MAKTSLDRLAHIANLSHDLQQLDSSMAGPVKSESDQVQEKGANQHRSVTPEEFNSRPRRLACTGCRQQKSKCDARERHPLPCTRCTKKNIQCSTEPDFKRTDKRQRLASIERELRELKDAFVHPEHPQNFSPTYASSPMVTIPSSYQRSVTPQEPLNQDRLNQDRLSQDRLSQDRLSQDRLDQDRLDQDRLDQDRLNQDRLNQDRLNQNRLNQDRLNQDRLNQDRLNQNRLNQDRLNQDENHNQSKSNDGALQETGPHLAASSAMAANPLPSIASSDGTPKEVSSVALPRDSYPPNSNPALADTPEYLCEAKTLGDITLGSALIRDLYAEYVQHYHSMLPVIDIAKGPERIYRLCPALFWVIMFVALRRVDHSLLLALTHQVKNILAEITISPITRYNPTEEDEPIMNACSVYSVQAFLLYTLWPPLTSSLSADSSWNTIGVALFQAIRIGLHSSGGLLSKQPTAQTAMAQESTRTWILCNIVSQNIATAFGFPAFVQFDFFSAQHCSISMETRHIMELAHFEDQVAKTLNMASTSHTAVVDINDRVALLKVLINQLADLEIKYSSQSAHDNGYAKFHSIVARIHLLTCYFLDAEHIPAFELSKGLVRLFNASVSLIEHVQMCEAKAKDFVKYLPVVQILNLWQASCLIVKLANSPLKSAIDMHASKETYTLAIRLVAKASVLKHDIAYRASGIMRNMWQLFRTLDEKNMTGFVLKIRSRMMASVFFDCLSLMRDQVGMAKLNIKTDNDAREDDSDGDSADEAIVSSEEGSPQKAHSSKTTPGSSESSSTRRKKRTLSGVQDAESKARRIIRTIPLDPQPIAASNRGSIFKVLNSDTSSPNIRLADSPTVQSLPSNSPSVIAKPNSDPFRKDMDFSSLFDMNNESLWKDVDSLMNDFAFPG